MNGALGKTPADTWVGALSWSQRRVGGVQLPVVALKK
jgi:hypothetical protein